MDKGATERRARAVGGVAVGALALVALLGTLRFADRPGTHQPSAPSASLAHLVVGREAGWVKNVLAGVGITARFSYPSSGKPTLWREITGIGNVEIARGFARVINLEVTRVKRPPLRLDQVSRADCRTAVPRRRAFYDQPLFGSGPLLVGGFLAHRQLIFQPEPGLGGRALLQFVVRPHTYTGPVLVRGKPVSGAGTLTFEERAATGAGGVHFVGTPHELHFPASHGQRIWGSVLRFPRPGCYALQVDGRSFSEVLAIRAAPFAGGLPLLHGYQY